MAGLVQIQSLMLTGKQVASAWQWWEELEAPGEVDGTALCWTELVGQFLLGLAGQGCLLRSTVGQGEVRFPPPGDSNTLFGPSLLEIL